MAWHRLLTADAVDVGDKAGLGHRTPKGTQEMGMKIKSNRLIEILVVALGLLSLTIEPMAQERRAQQRNKVGQMVPLVRAFRGRGKANENLPQAEKLEIGGDKLGQILKGNTTLVRLSVHTNFVIDHGYLIFRTGSSVTDRLNPASADGSEINGLLGKARFHGLVNEIEIGVRPQANKLYLLDVSIRHAPNCDRCGFSVTGPDGHTETWPANTSESQHLYFTFITNDADWYPLMLNGGTFEFDYCAVHEVLPL